MTAVLSPTDPLRNRHTSLDDNPLDYSPSITDWREKYHEVVDMLAETRAELDDFHQTSKELEAELENELQRTDRARELLQGKVSRAESERDEWKSKFMSLQTTHNTTTTSLQRELDRLRQEFQQTKVHLRELEMGNDDLERNERAVSSSLADMEAKYSRALEEKILLEHELLEKANLEEETQRLKDELRDANVETSILKDQLKTRNFREPKNSQPSPVPGSQASAASTEDLLNTPPPPDFDLAEISPSESLPSENNTTPKASVSRSGATASFLQRASFHQDKSSPLSAFKNASIMRSTTLPSFSSPTTSSPRGFIRPPVSRTASTVSTSTTGSGRSKGVQMVSEMRAKVRNLEQKINTRVPSIPRLRLGSITGRSNIAGPLTPITNSSSSAASNPSTAKTSWESQRRSAESRLSNNTDFEKHTRKEIADSSGWVLIMEDSPSPNKEKEKEAKRLKDKRRLSNPAAPTAFRPAASTNRATSPSLSTGAVSSLAISTGLRRPQSRLSGGGGAATNSRPQTPTFLPVPSSSVYASTSTSGLKRSTGPNVSNPYSQLKRSSLGKGTAEPVPPLPNRIRERPITMPPIGQTAPSTFNEPKALPTLPDLHSNVTVRSGSRMPSAASSTSTTSILSKSRIGRPSGGRRSGGETNGALDVKDLRPRSSSSAGLQ